MIRKSDLASRIVEAFTLRLAVGAAAIVCALSSARAADSGPAPDPGDSAVEPDAQPPLFGPVPFVESEPLLAEMRSLLAERSPSKRALSAGLAALVDWLRQTRLDPLARPTGQWLEARLLTLLGRRAEARAAWEGLATSPGPFSDDAREVLADLEDRDHHLAAAAHWRLTRAPWSPGFLAGARKSAADLERLGQPERAIELLEQALLQGMDPGTRTNLVLILAELHREAGHREHAEDLLLQTWWDEPATPDARLTRALRTLGALPDKELGFFREALWASRGDAARMLAKRAVAPSAAVIGKPARGRGPIHQAAVALLERWDDKRAAAVLAVLAALPALPSAAPSASRPHKNKRVAEPDGDTLVTLAIARGMLLRKLDQDTAAVDAFLFVHKHFPTHPLVHEARDQAATLLRTLDRSAEAEPLDAAILASSLPGERHRGALWRLGFAAILARDPKHAADYLRQLEWRHGGDPDRHSFCWFERARYWRGRAAQMAGDGDGARALWTSLVQRYPAGWYALVALTRLGTPKGAKPGNPGDPGKATGNAGGATMDPADVRGWDVSQDDPMATALALYRLGEERLAQDHFEALLGANQLPGNGRRLLSDLLELEGDTRKAERVMKYAAIPPSMPGDDPNEAYFDWYPLRFEEALGDAAKKNGLPSSLLAGVVSVETRFSASAKSHAGAIGAAQLLRTTGAAVGRKVFGKDFDARTLIDPDVNLAVAARYLADLIDRFQGHPALAVAAYNAGPGPVAKWLAARGQLELDAFVETIPFEQARRYVMRVLSDAEIYRRLYALDGHPIALPLSLDRAAHR